MFLRSEIELAIDSVSLAISFRDVGHPDTLGNATVSFDTPLFFMNLINILILFN